MTTLPESIAAIERDQPVQDRIWVLQRWGWAAFGLLVLLGAAGLFGDGPLAEARAAAPDSSLVVEHDRFQRTDATTTFTLVTLVPTDGRLGLCLGHDFLEVWRVMRFEPAAETETATAGGVCAALRTAAGAETRVRLFAQPRSTHLAARGQVWREGAAPVHLRVLVWP